MKIEIKPKVPNPVKVGQLVSGDLFRRICHSEIFILTDWRGGMANGVEDCKAMEIQTGIFHYLPVSHTVYKVDGTLTIEE